MNLMTKRKATRFNFTKAILEKLSVAQDGKRLYCLDTKVNGLGLATTANGTKSFYVVRRIGSNTKRVTLGRYPDMTIDQARKNAIKVLGMIADGIDPIDLKRDQRAAEITLRSAFENYLTAKKHLKSGTVYDYRKTIDQTFDDWLDKPLSAITKDKVRRRHQARSKESEARADNAFRVLRAVFNFSREVYEDSKGSSLFSTNPVDVLSSTKTWNGARRKRSFISKENLPAWFQAVMCLSCVNSRSNAEVIKVYLLFIFFTGARREETARLLWADVDLKKCVFTLRDTKNGTDVTLPMSDFLTNLMREHSRVSKGRFVFAGASEDKHIVNPTKQIKRVVKESGVNFTLHDLRRTFLTVAEGLDISHYALKRLVNHKSEEKADVTAGYVGIDVERLRRASQRITQELLMLSGYDSAENVVSLTLVR